MVQVSKHFVVNGERDLLISTGNVSEGGADVNKIETGCKLSLLFGTLR